VKPPGKKPEKFVPPEVVHYNVVIESDVIVPETVETSTRRRLPEAELEVMSFEPQSSVIDWFFDTAWHKPMLIGHPDKPFFYSWLQIAMEWKQSQCKSSLETVGETTPTAKRDVTYKDDLVITDDRNLSDEEVAEKRKADPAYVCRFQVWGDGVPKWFSRERSLRTIASRAKKPDTKLLNKKLDWEAFAFMHDPRAKNWWLNKFDDLKQRPREMQGFNAPPGDTQFYDTFFEKESPDVKNCQNGPASLVVVGSLQLPY
jgi:hypothetical protein